jgi:hypothetical protein
MLAAPSTPETVRIETLECAKAGEKVSVEGVKNAIAGAKTGKAPKAKAGSKSASAKTVNSKPLPDIVDICIAAVRRRIEGTILEIHNHHKGKARQKLERLFPALGEIVEDLQRKSLSPDDEDAEIERRGEERARKIKYVECTREIAGTIEDAFNDLADLAQGCRDTVDNTPESLQQTDRIQALDNSANELEGLETPAVPEALSKLSVTYKLPKKRHSSRAARAADAVTMLEACNEALKPNDSSEAQSLIEELSNAASTIECCEFPGMFG